MSLILAVSKMSVIILLIMAFARSILNGRNHWKGLNNDDVTVIFIITPWLLYYFIYYFITTNLWFSIFYFLSYTCIIVTRKDKISTLSLLALMMIMNSIFIYSILGSFFIKDINVMTLFNFIFTGGYVWYCRRNLPDKKN